MAVITIARRFGAGGKILEALVVEKLGIPQEKPDIKSGMVTPVLHSMSISRDSPSLRLACQVKST